MIWVLTRKLLRDLRVGLVVVCLLLFGFEFLWGKVTQQSVAVTGKLAEQMRFFREVFFESETGKLVQRLIGGDQIDFGQVQDALSIGYVHPLIQTILCIWAIGRASGAIAGELDRGTLELLLAQPVARYQLIAAHFVVDLVTIPLLALSMWAGTCLGVLAFGLGEPSAEIPTFAEVASFAPALANVALLLFAVTGYTMLLSAAGRWRPRVMGIAVLLTLLQFLINVIAQAWKTIEWTRPLTVFYYYQPQPLILGKADAAEAVRNAVVLCLIGTLGYVLALWTFCRRDLPAPL
jgi:ABC-2 type transport system permease protein